MLFIFSMNNQLTQSATSLIKHLTVCGSMTSISAFDHTEQIAILQILFIVRTAMLVLKVCEIIRILSFLMLQGKLNHGTDVFICCGYRM